MAAVASPWVRWLRPRMLGAALALFIVALAMPGRAPAYAEARYEEASVRAAMLLNLPKFIAWPAATGRPSTLCVDGAPAVYEALKALTKDARAAGRTAPFEVVEGMAPGCRYLYRGGADSLDLSTLPPDCLVIGDRESRVDSAIELVRRGERVVIRVNRDGLVAAGFTVDARLLQLAEVFGGA